MKISSACWLKRIILCTLFLSVVGIFWIGSSIFFKDLPASGSARSLLYEPSTSSGTICVGRVCQVLFSPDDDVVAALLGLIEEETTTILVAQYILSSSIIARSLIKAHKRGVMVELVTDQFCFNSPVGKARLLMHAGIPVYIYEPKSKDTKFFKKSSLMHHKFFVFSNTIDGKRIVVTGSFNCTLAASRENQENCVFLEDPRLFEAFSHQFQVLKRRSNLAAVT